MLNILKLLSDFRIVRAISLLRKLEHVSNVYRRAGLTRSTEENHGTTFVFHYTIRDNDVESQNMRLLEQDDVLQRDFRQITESTETIFPFLKVSNSYYHTPTYILNLLFSVKKKQKKKKLKTTLALHTYLTRIPLYITDFFFMKIISSAGVSC